MKSLFMIFLAGISFFACTSSDLVLPEEPRMHVLLHQKSWQVAAIVAESADGTTTDWLAQNPACIRDNIFITEAPGTGMVGALHAEEGGLRCQDNDLVYQHHIASWKLNASQDIFSVTIFDRGHRMLYGFPAEESFITENWVVEELSEQRLKVRVEKNMDGERIVFRVGLNVP
jgi:hypothetical protein